jgi:hypothetical protein
MKKRIQLNQKELNKLVKRIVEQVEDDYYKISPEEYKDLLKFFSYSGKLLTKYKKFQGKPLWITGDLDVSGEPIDSLGNIKYIDGRLDISNTKISNIEGIDVKRYVSDYGSPRAKIREKKELEDKLQSQNAFREDEEWSLENADDVGLKANALFNHLVDEGDIDPLSDDDKEKLIVLKRKLQDLEREYDEVEDSERVSDLFDSIEETKEEIDELQENDVDVYMIHPLSYTHYGLQTFEVLIPGFKDQEYAVGTYDEMDEAALSYAKNILDDTGIDGFSQSFIEDYLDVDSILSSAEEDYDYWVRDSPESYFNDDDYELTSEQEERIEQIESEIEDYEQQQRDLDTDDENYDDYYDDFQNLIDQLQEELEEIVPGDEPTEEMIEDKVAELVREVERDPISYLKDYNYDISSYIDEDALAQGVVDSDGWGVMNGYDGNYYDVMVGDSRYYVMRIN